jgi:hypothetical protein
MVGFLRGAMLHYLKKGAEKKEGLARHSKAVLDVYLDLEPNAELVIL